MSDLPEIDRFELWELPPLSRPEFEKDPEGNWVRYEDHAAQMKILRELRAGGEQSSPALSQKQRERLKRVIGQARNLDTCANSIEVPHYGYAGFLRELADDLRSLATEGGDQ